jgi:hypothetical protein
LDDVPLSGHTATGTLLIAVPILFNATFALLAARFDYPDILREPTHEVLARFRDGGSQLILIWWGFAISAVLFTPLVVLFAAKLSGADPVVITLSVVVGVLASLVQFLGLIRWPFLVPYLAREAEGVEPGSSRGETIDLIFQSFHRYLGVAVGEYLGYTLTGAWSILTGVALIQTDTFAPWLGVAGVLIGPLFLVSSLEFLGSREPEGWTIAGKITPVAYILWSLWLVALGVAVIT